MPPATLQSFVTDEGVEIGGHCFAVSSLCHGFPLENSSLNHLYFHPEHVAVCRDYSFWKAKKGHCPPGWKPCNGNFPGFCYNAATAVRYAFITADSPGSHAHALDLCTEIIFIARI